MSTIPFLYRTAYTWSGDAAAGTIQVVPDALESDTAGVPLSLPVGSPHDSNRYSPEHLLVFAAETCLANYVVLLARLSKVEIIHYCSQAVGELEQEERAGYRFKSIHIQPELTVAAGQETQAQRLLTKAHKLCLIARSLNCPVELVEPRIIAQS